MGKFDLNNQKVLIISIILLLVAALSIILYINEQNKNLNIKLTEMNKELSADLNQLGQNLGDDISSLNENLTGKIGIIDTNLKNFKSKNEREINALVTLIDEIEEKSEIQLSEIKDELKSIQVQSQDFTLIIEDVLQSVVSVGTNKGLGSGAVIDDRGFIVTNYHVINGANIIRVLTYDNNVYDAVLIGYEDTIDVAVLKIDASLDALRFGDSDSVDVGERVIALGNPAGLSFSVTEGIVSAVHRKGPNDLEIYLQTDVPINPGNSGGPLVNTNSRIIGINNFKIGGYEGLGFAIESNTVEQITDDIIGQYLEQIAE